MSTPYSLTASSLSCLLSLRKEVERAKHIQHDNMGIIDKASTQSAKVLAVGVDQIIKEIYPSAPLATIRLRRLRSLSYLTGMGILSGKDLPSIVMSCLLDIKAKGSKLESPKMTYFSPEFYQLVQLGNGWEQKGGSYPKTSDIIKLVTITLKTMDNHEISSSDGNAGGAGGSTLAMHEYPAHLDTLKSITWVK